MGPTPGQLACITTLDKPLVVAAGAGSGKTFTLTKRIVHALESGYVEDIDQVLAITFTTKAADELRSRIKGSLRACGMIDQALKVDDAWISTIHGMCSRLLRAHAIELGIDPGFSVADESTLSAYRERAVEQVLLECEERGDSCALNELFAEFKPRSAGEFGGASVEDLLLALMDEATAHPDGADAFMLPPAGADPAYVVDEAFEILARARALMEGEKPSTRRDEAIAAASQALEEYAAVCGQKTFDTSEVLDLAARCPKLGRGFGGQAFKESMGELSLELQKRLLALRLEAARPLLETLIRLTRRACELFESYKRAAGQLDNNDLLTLAARAIESHPAIARDYVSRFKLVMIDEFQDTDQMQVDMVKRLSGREGEHLCTVGDWQQSIYRFRGADVSVYRRHLKQVAAHDPRNVIYLFDNFRSHGDVLSFVDRVFGQASLFGGEFNSLSHGRDEGLVKRPFPEDFPRVSVQLHSGVVRRTVGRDAARALQAQGIAARFAQLVERGCSQGDLVVLLGSMTHADVYAQALRDAGMTCVIAGGSVFRSALEPRIVLDLARVAANPQETASLYRVLASDMFALGSDDLLLLATRFDEEGRAVRRGLDRGVAAVARVCAENPDEAASLSPELRLAAQVLGDLWAHAGSGSLSALMERAITASGWLSRLEACKGEGLAAAANVYKALHIVSDLERAGAGTASVAEAFATYLDCAKEKPGALSASGGEFVRIMTVHASKGLEFPVVAVAELKNVEEPSSKLLVEQIGGRLYVSLDLDQGVRDRGLDKIVDAKSVYASLTDEDADEEALADAVARAANPLAYRAALRRFSYLGESEESKRLLYVALTRAKEALVVSLYGRRTKDDPSGVGGNLIAGAVTSALAGPTSYFKEGRSSFPYGGSLDASVEHVYLPELDPAGDFAADAGGSAVDAGDSAGDSASAPATEADFEPHELHVPVYGGPAKCKEAPYRSQRADVFSYSSLAEVPGLGDTVQELADRFTESVDAAAPDDALAALVGMDGRSASSTASAASDDAQAALVEDGDLDAEGLRVDTDGPSDDALADDDGDRLIVLGAPAHRAADADKATDFGTAFHRLAQYAVAFRAPGTAPMRPDPVREQAVSKACELGHLHRMRLDRALDRWFSSETARSLAAYGRIEAEMPFFVALDVASADADAGERAGGASSADAFLEGEMDLVAFDDAHDRVLIIDYKTGGSAEEDAGALARKHVLQASCYALVLLRQGFSEVEALFVRVEHESCDRCGEPQCVRYRFSAEDLPALERAVVSGYRLLKG